MSRGARVQALAVAGLFVALVAIGARNLQLTNFHLFIGLLVALIAGVLVVFAVSVGRDKAGGRG
ncbi:MAG: hypothetical protein HY725_13545 [Candidatus Rokubacteria bacterium]|nr:hypothetical protein [Candidatus Rokubacteria bacterium]